MRRVDDEMSIIRYIRETKPEVFLDASGVYDWITEVRQPAHGRLDIEATAGKLGLALAYNQKMMPQGTYHEGFSNGRLFPIITLRNDDVDVERRRLSVVMGHELGHHFLNEVRGIGFSELSSLADSLSFREEQLCDLIGLEFALPLAEIPQIADELTILELSEHYQIGISDVILQLMRSNRLPTYAIIKSRYSQSAREELASNPYETVMCYFCHNPAIGDGSCQAIGTDDLLVLDFTDVSHDVGASIAACGRNNQLEIKWFNKYLPHREQDNCDERDASFEYHAAIAITKSAPYEQPWLFRQGTID